MADTCKSIPRTFVEGGVGGAGLSLSPIIAPSLLACDMADLAGESKSMVSCGADWLHVDVMDGHFVPNLTLGAPIVSCLRKHTGAYLDVHLMVTHPEQWVESFAAAGANGFTFHLEAVQLDRIPALVSSITERNMRAGLCIKPGTPIEPMIEVLKANPGITLALIMTVEPGFGGQKFMSAMMPKVRELRRHFPTLDVQVDGGLDTVTVVEAAEAGANVIVAGTSIFKAKDGPGAAIAQLRGAVSKAWGGGSS